MGYYLNPPGAGTHGKSTWCEENGISLDGLGLPTWEQIPKDCCVIFVVNNGPFEAAAIAYKKDEYEYLQDPGAVGGRPVKHFMIEKKKAVDIGAIKMGDFQ